jgi:hypothetical protein
LVGNVSMITISGKRKAEKRQFSGADIRRPKEDKTSGAVGRGMAKGVRAVETR